MVAEPPEPAYDQATLRFYSVEAPVYVAKGKHGATPRLEALLDLLPTNARILELGCGSGRDAEVMIAAGFDVDPTDGTPEMARQAARRLGREVRIMRFDQLDAREEYDAVWANASLLHVPRSALSGILGRVHAALKRGGLHFASYKSGECEGRDDIGRYYNFPSRDIVEAAYGASADWEFMSVAEYAGGGYDGRTSNWIGVTARRRP